MKKVKLKFKTKDNEAHVMYRQRIKEVINEIIDNGTIEIYKEGKDEPDKFTPTAMLHLVYTELYSRNYVGINECYPTLDSVANGMRINKATVSRAITILEYYGVIIVKRKYNKSTGKTTHKYFFPLEFKLLTEEGEKEFKDLLLRDDVDEWDDYYDNNIATKEEKKDLESLF